MNWDCDVAIVGFGPVGATLANLLGTLGFAVVVVERNREIYDKPRAITLDHEAMRLFQSCGLAHRIAPLLAPHPGTDYLGVDGQVIKRFYPLPPPWPLGWAPNAMFIQPELEAVLRDGVARCAKVRLRLGEEAVDLAQDGSAVRLTLRAAAGGTESRITARYLVACDGAGSVVRRRLAIAQEDLAFDEWWAVVDTWLRRETALPELCVQYCLPSRPATFIRGPRNLRRWEIKLLPGERPEEFQNERRIRQVLAPLVDTDAIELWRIAVYRFHAVVAREWRRGRVFLMGDAAHQMPPFMGQGLCAGLRDAGNFAWKLDLVEHHAAPPALLEAYAAERQPHVRQLVATTKEFGLVIGETDREAALRRDERLRAELARGAAETIRQRYIPGLAAGIIDRAAPAAGTLFVQPWIAAAGDAALLDDRLRGRFLIATADPAAQRWLDAGTIALWRRIGGERVVITSSTDAPADADDETVRSVAEQDGLFRAWLQEHGCAAVIVRPDRYVYGGARDGADLNRLAHGLGRQLYRC
jgi:3-(3-hydroxy-phenyl)propionate hydroxylase